MEELSISEYRNRLLHAFNASNLYKDYGEFKFILDIEKKKEAFIREYKEYEKEFIELNRK